MIDRCTFSYIPAILLVNIVTVLPPFGKSDRLFLLACPSSPYLIYFNILMPLEYVIWKKITVGRKDESVHSL